MGFRLQFMTSLINHTACTANAMPQSSLPPFRLSNFPDHRDSLHPSLPSLSVSCLSRSLFWPPPRYFRQEKRRLSFMSNGNGVVVRAGDGPRFLDHFLAGLVKQKSRDENDHHTRHFPLISATGLRCMQCSCPVNVGC